MPREGVRPTTNQVYPIDNDQGAATAERLVVAQAAHAALLAATVALDRVEATVGADAADPAYRAVATRRLTARAALSAALRGLQGSPAALS